MMDFKTEGLEELMSDLATIEQELPYGKDELLEKSSRKFIKLCKDKTPYRPLDKKHIKNSYKVSEVKRDGDMDYVETTNTAPHFHLIERGHIQKNPKTMETTGFVQGVHMVERSADEFEEDYPEIVGELADKMIRKINK